MCVCVCVCVCARLTMGFIGVSCVCTESNCNHDQHPKNNESNTWNACASWDVVQYLRLPFLTKCRAQKTFCSVCAQKSATRRKFHRCICSQPTRKTSSCADPAATIPDCVLSGKNQNSVISLGSGNLSNSSAVLRHVVCCQKECLMGQNPDVVGCLRCEYTRIYRHTRSLQLLGVFYMSYHLGRLPSLYPQKEVNSGQIIGVDLWWVAR